MAVLKKEKHKELLKELYTRYAQLNSALEGRKLTSATEGCKRGSWLYPETLVATRGTDLEIKLAISDFKAILTELSKIDKL